MRRFDDNERKRILSMWRRGQTADAIAKSLGAHVTVEQVRGVLVERRAQALRAKSALRRSGGESR